jgi:uncharacterized LabA/DUF88 family protein
MQRSDKAHFIPPKNKNDLTPLLNQIIKGKKVGVYIDSANLYYAASKANLKLDYFQLAKWFQTHCDLISLNFYTAYDPLDTKQLDFFTDLERAGYNLIKKPIRIFADSIKGNMDIELAVDTLVQKEDYDVLILISGDGDFSYLVKALESIGKLTIILGVGGFTSFELHQEANNYFFLNRISSVWQKTGRRTGAVNPAIPAKTQKLNENRKQPATPSSLQPKVEKTSQQDQNKTLKVRVRLSPKPKIFLS